MRPGTAMAQGGWPRPGKAIKTLMLLNVVLYVLELILLRAGGSAAEEIFGHLTMTPAAVFERFEVWQLLTYPLLHDPTSPWHLLQNILFLYMFGAPLESWWKSKRVVTAYVVCALAGGVFTLLVALLFNALGWLPRFWITPHLGASGAVMGLTIAWGIVFADQTMNFLFLGAMKGRTFVWIAVAFELLTALSFSTVSSTSHFGGMIGAFILCNGLWKPGNVADMFRRYRLKTKRRKIERELRVIEGGKSEHFVPPKAKNGGPKNGAGTLN